MKKRPLRLLVVAATVAVVGGAVWFWNHRNDHNHGDRLVLYGNIDLRQVNLAINGNERIAELLAEEGDVVEQGQLLARLELERFQYTVQKAEAAVETQRQVVARLLAGSRPKEIDKAKADTAAAEAARRDAQLTLARVKALVEKDAATQQDLDNAIAAADAASARYRAAKATMELVIEGPRKEDIAAAKARLKQLEAELLLARHALDDAFLYAPNPGIIQDRLLEVGDMAAPQLPVFTMALTDPMWVRAYVAEPDLGLVWEGMKATITTDSFPGKQYDGWVGYISPTAEFTPKPVETRELRTKLVYQVRVFVRNPNRELRLGMPVTVTIDLTQQPPAMPERAEPKSASDTPQP